MTTYDKYYEEEGLFGEPYPELIDFLKTYPEKGSVLDIGCGQGRNAIALAKIGYDVTGIDTSKVGIAQMLKVAASEGLSIEGIVTDIYTFNEYA